MCDMILKYFFYLCKWIWIKIYHRKITLTQAFSFVFYETKTANLKSAKGGNDNVNFKIEGTYSIFASPPQLCSVENYII